MMYEHYKNGQKYVVEGNAVNPNTGEVIVVYRTIAPEPGDPLYWRPKSEFDEKFRQMEPVHKVYTRP